MVVIVPPLIKSLGALPEEWTKNYVAEVVLGLEYLINVVLYIVSSREL